MILALACVVLLPTFVIIKAVEFATSEEVNNAIEWKTATEVPYPNITLCHSDFFSSKAMKEYNVSNSLASYISHSVDPSFPYFYDSLGTRDTPFQAPFLAMMDSLEKEMEDVLQRNNMDILELFHALAIKCDDFVFFCEIHREYYMPDTMDVTDKFRSCCDYFFGDAPPTFSTAGTCFTSKVLFSLEHLVKPKSQVFLCTERGHGNNPQHLQLHQDLDRLHRG